MIRVNGVALRDYTRRLVGRARWRSRREHMISACVAARDARRRRGELLAGLSDTELHERVNEWLREASKDRGV